MGRCMNTVMGRAVSVGDVSDFKTVRYVRVQGDNGCMCVTSVKKHMMWDSTHADSGRKEVGDAYAGAARSRN